MRRGRRKSCRRACRSRRSSTGRAAPRKLHRAPTSIVRAAPHPRRGRRSRTCRRARPPKVPAPRTRSRRIASPASPRTTQSSGRARQTRPSRPARAPRPPQRTTAPLRPAHRHCHRHRHCRRARGSRWCLRTTASMSRRRHRRCLRRARRACPQTTAPHGSASSLSTGRRAMRRTVRAAGCTPHCQSSAAHWPCPSR